MSIIDEIIERAIQQNRNMHEKSVIKTYRPDCNGQFIDPCPKCEGSIEDGQADCPKPVSTIEELTCVEC